MTPELALLLLAVAWAAELAIRLWHLLPRDRSVFQ